MCRMEFVEVNVQKKIQCSYEYRENVVEKFAPVSSNREEALKGNTFCHQMAHQGRKTSGVQITNK